MTGLVLSYISRGGKVCLLFREIKSKFLLMTESNVFYRLSTLYESIFHEKYLQTFRHIRKYFFVNG